MASPCRCGKTEIEASVPADQLDPVEQRLWNVIMHHPFAFRIIDGGLASGEAEFFNSRRNPVALERITYDLAGGQVTYLPVRP